MKCPSCGSYNIESGNTNDYCLDCGYFPICKTNRDNTFETVSLSNCNSCVSKSFKEERGCIYCNGGVALAIGETDSTNLEYGISIRHPNKLNIYGSAIKVGNFMKSVADGINNLIGSNGIVININYCPKCGSKLEDL